MSKEILTFLGFKEDVTLDDFKKEFETKFVNRKTAEKDSELISKITGSRIGSLETKVKAIAKKHGVELKAEHLTDKQVEDILETSFDLLVESGNKAIDEAKTQGAAGTDVNVKRLEKELEKANERIKEEKEGRKTAITEHEKYKQEVIVQARSGKISDHKKAKLGEYKFKQGISEIEKLGFNAILEEKFEVDLDEKSGDFIVLDKKTKKQMPSAKIAGELKSLDEVIDELAVSQGINLKNEFNGKPAFSTQVKPTVAGQPAQVNGAPVQSARELHPLAGK
jgi:hypothetical protein